MTRTLALGLTLALTLTFGAACTKMPRASAHRDEPAHQATPPTSERAHLRAELAAHRAKQVERLAEYARSGQFPHNYAEPTAAHVFRDAAGRLCAVANLVHRDGRDDLVEATVKTHNDLAIADVEQGAMLDWILSSGLTQEELARIQLPAPPLARPTRRVEPVRDIANRVDEPTMNTAVVRHIELVERELRADADASLDVATERLLARRSAVVARL